MLHVRLAVAGILVVLFAVTPSTTAWHCQPSTSTTDANQVVLAGESGSYVVADTGVGRFGVFLYEESNGIDGLQRKDANRDDTCHDSIPADKEGLA